MPPMPEGVREGVLKGLYLFRAAPHRHERRVHLFGSSSILREALRAQEILDEQYRVAADVYSATSYQQLRREALAAERWNRLHPEAPPRRSYLETFLANLSGPCIAAGDTLKAVPDQIARWVPGGLTSLGTDGYGRSDSREALRRFFEVDAAHIAVAALAALAREGKLEPRVVSQAIRDFGIDPDRGNPADL